jgi:GAF domain-containing protein/CheY-like chemotaxis protein
MAQERILIIDDKIEIITFLTDLLEPLGYRLSTAFDGREGLKRALQERPDLILLDVNMPGLSGIEVLEGLQRQGVRTPVILMTLYGSESVAVQAFRLGARNYITKPIDLNELLVAIDWALEEGRLRRERERLVHELAWTNKQLTRRMHELATLQAIGRSVASLMPLQDLLRRIVDAVLYLSDADAAALFLQDQTSGQLHLEAVRQGEVYQANLQAGIRDSHAEDVLRSGQPLWVSRPTKHTGVTGYLGDQASSLLYVPVKLGKQVVGVVGSAYSGTDQEPSAEIQKRLTALADYAAIALKNSQLYESSQQRAEQMATINRIAQMTASSLELKEVMRIVVQGIRDSLQAETATLALLDEERQEVVFEILLRDDRQVPTPIRLQVGEGIVGWVVQHGQALRVDDAAHDPRFCAGVDEATGFRTQSILCVPLTVSDRVIGAIEAINKLDNGPTGRRGLFSEQDEALLQGAAAFVAIAVENARLHEAVRETAAIQAVHQTMVTLSHYLNNSLQALLGTSELLQSELGDSRTADKVGCVIRHQVRRIGAVLSVLHDLASPESTVYLETTRMLDIERELQARLASTTDTEPILPGGDPGDDHIGRPPS